MSVLHGISLADPMIESDRVEGLPVDDVSGRHLGVIKRLLIERDLGRVTYAIVVHHGPMGFGTVEHEVPWSELRYDSTIAGFRTDLTRRDAAKALVGSDRLRGIAVFDSENILVGRLERLLIDKESGIIGSAEVLHHQIFGHGPKERRVPWNSLNYDARLGGYRTIQV